MSSKKQYKNVYTILEKVKKGEIQTHYNERDGLFSKLKFYEKPDLIKPYVHYIDQWRIDSIVRDEIKNVEAVTKMYNKFVAHSSFKKLADDKKPDLKNFFDKLQDNYQKLPEHLKYDVQKMYYHTMDKLDFVDRTEKNNTKFKFLEMANNPVGKIMSEGSNLKSAIFTKNMIMYYLVQMTMMDYIDPQTKQEVQDGLNGQGDGNGKGQSDAMSKMFGNDLAKKMLDQAMDQAQQTCKMIDETLDQDIQEQLYESSEGGGVQAGKLSPDYLRNIASHLAKMKMSTGSLKEKIKKLLDKTASYFSAATVSTYDDLLNAQDVSGLDEYILLHPRLRKIFIEDIQIKETKPVGKIDVYVDISGSMNENCGVHDDNGKQITKIEFAKCMMAKLKEMDMLNDVYLFNTSTKKYRNDLISISMIGTSGGTTIDSAINRIENNGNNALVITDAEDSCSIYSEKAYFIGVNGARFNHFNQDVLKRYHSKDQLIMFNGKQIFNIDHKGYAITK